MKKLIQIAAIDPNPHRDLTRYPPNPEQVKKLIESIGRTGFWNNLVVRPHPEQEGRYQLAYGHNRIAACQKAGVTEAELEVIELSDYDMLCCMIDENLTQQHISPKTIFEIVAAAIKEAEKMLRETNNVYEFNAQFKHSRGLPTLLQESQCLDQDNVISWRDNEYQKAKAAIEPFGDGLGRGFIQHFLPKNSVSNNNTLQAAITAYYQETWRKEGERLLEQSQLELWKGGDSGDADRMAKALELEKQARVLLGKVKQGGISRTLLETLDSTSKMGDVVSLVRKNHIPEKYHAELVDLATGWSADSPTTQKAGTSILIKGEAWWEITSGQYAARIRAMKDRIKQQELRDKLGSMPLHKVVADLISDIGSELGEMDEPLEQLKLAADYFGTLQENEVKKIQDRLLRLKDALAADISQVEVIIREINIVLQAREKEINPSVNSLQLEKQIA